MEGSSVKELSAYRFEKARSNTAIAKTLFASEEYEVALNRAYYSAFDAMRAVNALDGFDSSKHSGVIAHFNQKYVKTGIFPPTASATIRKASMLREKSDYEDFYKADKDETADIIDRVEILLSEVEAYLGKQGIFNR